MDPNATRPYTLTKYGVKQFDITEEEYVNLGELVDSLAQEVSLEGVFIVRLKTWKEDHARANVAKVKAYIESDKGHNKFHPEWLRRRSIIDKALSHTAFKIIPHHDQTVDKVHANKLRRMQSQMKKTILDFDFFAANFKKSDLETALLERGVENCLDVLVEALLRNDKDILYLTNMSLDESLKTTDTVSMHSLKTNLESLGNGKIVGITVPTAYVGSEYSTFSCHREDCAFCAVNRHIAGSTKVWFCIPPRYYDAFQALLRLLPLEDKKQTQTCYMQHKQLWIDPRIVMKGGIPVYTIEQRPGDIVIVLPNTIHFGFNCSLNLSESVNFVSKIWVFPGMLAQQRCKCYSAWDATFELKQVLKDLSVDASLIDLWETRQKVILNKQFKKQSKLLYTRLRDMGDEPVSWCTLLGPGIHENCKSEFVCGFGCGCGCKKVEENPCKLPSDQVQENPCELPSEQVQQNLCELPSEQVQQNLCELPSEQVQQNLCELPSEQVEEKLCELPSEGIMYLCELPSEFYIYEVASEQPSKDKGLQGVRNEAGQWATCTRCSYCPYRYMGDAPKRIYKHAVKAHGEGVAKEVLKEVMEKYAKKTFKTKGQDCEYCGKNIRGSITNMRNHQRSKFCNRPQNCNDGKDIATNSKRQLVHSVEAHPEMDFNELK